ncbi:DEAD/DEAH box helicase [Sediminicola luteus]|uniref:DEAD/DEAH box helicase n=1 Tax=Sediminicola luteus TaxID=319238 RepID=A0A2A4G7K2_9FLAO|nr:DEAD/DEAH box helicase [Sediminicola luteus]PCE63722.1 DEAD/DEAH box helicase [Sediminicola luteus]
MSDFKSLGVTPHFVKSLAEIDIKRPTQIQEKTVPFLLNEIRDFVGQAPTGTGKTAAFGLPLLHQIDPDKAVVQGLILAPTRELAQQIKKQLFKFTKYAPKKIFVEAVFGGAKIEPQIKALNRTTHIVVATPGRLLELVEKGVLDIQQVKTLVLDEADEMLSLGFKQDLNRILKYAAGQRKTWLFSATMPEDIKKIIRNYMASDAMHIRLEEGGKLNPNIEHRFIQLPVKEKFRVLTIFLRRNRDAHGVIFCKTKAEVRNLFESLNEQGFQVAALEGDMTQKDRDKVMRAFKGKKLKVLISTDIAARGIDVRDLAYVIHYRLPEQLEYYTHRSGRTARAGKSGVSLAFIVNEEMPLMRRIENELDIRFKKLEI